MPLESVTGRCHRLPYCWCPDSGLLFSEPYCLLPVTHLLLPLAPCLCVTLRGDTPSRRGSVPVTSSESPVGLSWGSCPFTRFPNTHVENFSPGESGLCSPSSPPLPPTTHRDWGPWSYSPSVHRKRGPEPPLSVTDPNFSRSDDSGRL